MTIEEVYKFIPKSINLGGTTIAIEVKDEIEISDVCVFGYWKPVEEKIVLFTKVEGGDGTEYELNRNQIRITFLHEIVHAICDASGIDNTETTAQTFATFLNQALLGTNIF